MRTRPLILSVLATVAAGAGLLAAAPASAQSIDLSTCSQWSINNNQFTCTPNNNNPPPAGAPSGCAVSPSSVNNLPPGSSMPSLVASCSGTQANSWAWKLGGAAVTPGTNGATSTYSAGTVTANTTVTATPYNGSTAGNPINVSVTVAPPTGGGNTAGGISCAPMGTVVIPLKGIPGSTSASVWSANFGSFTNTSIAVVTFTTGAATGNGTVSFAEFAGGPVDRTAALSTTPCGFGAAALTTRYGTGQTISFQVGGTNSRKPVLQPNTTYYLNVRNQDYWGNQTCTGNSCDIRADVNLP